MKAPSHKLHLAGAAMAVIAAWPVASAETNPAETARVVVPSVTQAKPPAAEQLLVVVPCAVGSPGDLIARAVARTLSERLERQVAVENVTGGTGNPAAEASKQGATSSNAIFLLPAGESDVSPCGE